MRPVSDPQGHGGAEPSHTKPQPGRRLRPYVTATAGVGREGTGPAISKPGRAIEAIPDGAVEARRQERGVSHIPARP
ncbi:hypothetical protein MTP02_35270 [Streptomyces albus]|nr:hypothetical protein MTP02_35270 [Streptomyces albus]